MQYSSSFESAQRLLETPGPRPTPQHMAQLIVHGMTELTLRDAWDSLGQPTPEMELTLTDLNTLIPYIHNVTDSLADSSYPSQITVFAARDAELLYDDFAITHAAAPGHAVLIPASRDLWDSRSWNDPAIGQKFLEAYALDQAKVVDPATRLTVADTGFVGNIGRHIDRRLQQLHGVSLLEDNRLKIKLFCAAPESVGSNIINISDTNINHETSLPKTALFIPPHMRNHYGPAYMFATSLQLMPHYHGPYIGLTERDNKITGMTTNAPVDLDVDRPAGYNDGVNATFVNRLAAAVVQYTALDRVKTDPTL